MATYHYQRVLVKFRTSMPEQWSDLHWCDIEQDSEHHQIRIKVAPANMLNMPADREFVSLSAEQTKKLLVVDVSSEESSLYCLVCTDTTLCRFNFNPLGEQYMRFGKYWSLRDDDYAMQPDLALKKVFSADQIVADRRLQMRAQPLIDYQVLHAITPNTIERLKQQYQNRQQGLARQAVEEDLIRDAIAAEEIAVQEERQAILSQWLNDRHVPVVINIHDIQSKLDEVNRALLIHPVCETLTAMKENTQSVDEYENVLLSILQRSEQTADVSDPSKFAVQSFRDRFLGNSHDLNILFSENNNAPFMSEVYHFVLDVVFEELKTHRPDYQYLTSSDYKKGCPDSYTTQRLGQPVASGVQRARLVDVVFDVDGLAVGGGLNYAPPHLNYRGRLFNDPRFGDDPGYVPPRQRPVAAILQNLGNNAPPPRSSSLRDVALLLTIAGFVFSTLTLHLFLTGGSLGLVVGALVCTYSLFKVSSNILSLLRENQPATHAPIAVEQAPLSRILDLRPW